MICVNNKYNNIERYYVNNYYKSYLSAFHKNFMDPFKRTKTSLKFMYKCNGFEFITSLCQLNFIKWSFFKYFFHNIENKKYSFTKLKFKINKYLLNLYII